MSKAYRLANSLRSEAMVEKCCRGNSTPYKHIAGLYIGGKRRTVGVNHLRNVLAGKSCFSIHAEVDALRRWLQENRYHEYLPLLSDDDVIQSALYTLGSGGSSCKGGKNSEIHSTYSKFYKSLLPKIPQFQKEHQCLLRKGEK